jgi:DNA-binding MarR family transcriptional regulator
VSETKWLNAEESRAWRALQNLNMPLSAELNRQLTRSSNLSNADYAVLVQLSESAEKRMRARDLGTAMGWEKSRLSHHIRRMESRSLVTREECATDGRGAFIALTPIGQSTIEQAAPQHVQTVRTYVIDLLTPEQLRVLAEIGETVGARLNAACHAADAAESCSGEEVPDESGACEG